jgi:hypothetical protein
MSEVRRRASYRGSGRGLLIAGLLLAVGCGGEKSPTGPSPTATGISVTQRSESTVYIGKQVQFDATVTLSDGSSQPAANATWNSDAPSVATVSPTGLGRGVAAGAATISAEIDSGEHGSVRIRVYPEFQGTWTGSWQATGCTASGGPLWIELCTLLQRNPSDARSQVTLVLTQNGGLVDGTVDLGDVAGGSEQHREPFDVSSGEVSEDGTLRLALQPVTRIDRQQELQVAVPAWEARADTPGRMTGRIQVELSTEEGSDLEEPGGALVIDGSLMATKR